MSDRMTQCSWSTCCLRRCKLLLLDSGVAGEYAEFTVYPLTE